MSCCEYTPSMLKKRIVIEQLSLAANDSGGQTETWSTFATVWSSITPKIVKEVNLAQRIEPRVDHDIVIRYLANINSKMRVKFGTRYFEIKAIINVKENNEWLELSASERTGT